MRCIMPPQHTGGHPHEPGPSRHRRTAPAHLAHRPPRHPRLMLYDVVYLNKANGGTPGLATDTVTGSKRYALERAQTLRDRGVPAHVTNTHGDTIAMG